jgi:hypothetical protein
VIPTSPTPPQFNNSTNSATTAFVQRALGNYQGSLSFSAGGAQALVAEDAGKQVILSGVTSGTLALPTLASVGEGASFIIKAESAAGWSVTCPDGAAIVYNGGGNVSSIAILVDTFLIITKNGGLWRTYGTLIGFSASLAANGYQRLPDGMIIQWGTALTSGSADVFVTFPIAFPTTVRSVVGTPTASGSGVFASVNGSVASGFNLSAWTSNSTRNVVNVPWIAIGH